MGRNSYSSLVTRNSHKESQKLKKVEIAAILCYNLHIKQSRLCKSTHINIRENQAEYYAKIVINDFIIHLIQLHFPDMPPDVNISFQQESKDFMVATLNYINKTNTDIIIVVAHSFSGFWHQLLSQSEQKVLLSKADLVLSGTSHFFDRAIDPLFDDNGALILNAGSITDPFFFTSPGFIQVNVLKEPTALAVQFIDVRKEYRLASNGFAFIKPHRGRIRDLSFVN